MRCLAVLAALTACNTAPDHLLVFSRTLGYRHDDAIIAGMQELPALLAPTTVDFTEDPTAFTDANLANYGAVFFMYTSGNDILDADQKAAFEAFVRAGGGWLGIHSASDTEFDWPFYQSLVVAHFDNHPMIQSATVNVEVASHPTMTSLPAVWPATDEWYNFASNPRDVAGVQVLATIDETTYEGGTMGADHPMVWCHEKLGGRAFYSELGHVATRWQEPLFRQSITDAVRWVMHR